MAAPVLAVWGNPYLDRLQAERTHLAELNCERSVKLLVRWHEFDGDARRQVMDDIAQDRYRVERIDQQIAWQRYLRGDAVMVVPNGPAWCD